MRNSFFLVIPSQKKQLERLKLYEESALQQWVAELPTANPDLATRLLQDFIEVMNRTEMGSRLRLDAMEQLIPSYHLIEEYLRSCLIKSGFPKSEAEQKVFSKLVVVEKEFTIAYWIVVREMTRRDVNWLQGKYAALSLYRVVKGLSSVVVSYHMLFLPVPEWVWMDLHSLYKLSEKIKKDKTRVPDETGHFSKTSTISDCYRQILLFSLSRPSGMMQKEMGRVYTYIERMTPLIKLDSNPIMEQEKQCVVFQDEDKAPFWSVSEQVESESAALFLDMTRLKKVLDQSSKLAGENEARFGSIHSSNNKTDKLPVDLNNYILSSWSGRKRSPPPVFADRMERYFCIGLNTTHAFQCSINEKSDGNVEYLAESASSTTLICKSLPPGSLSIGSMTSFRQTDAPDYKRSLGIVNSISMVKADGVIEFGIETFAMQAYAVSYLGLHARKVDEPQHALIYGVKGTEDEKSYLIIQSYVVKDGDILRLFMQDDDFPIIIRDRVNVGLGYWQFECRRIEEQDASRVKNQSLM